MAGDEVVASADGSTVVGTASCVGTCDEISADTASEWTDEGATVGCSTADETGDGVSAIDEGGGGGGENEADGSVTKTEDCTAGALIASLVGEADDGAGSGVGATLEVGSAMTGSAELITADSTSTDDTGGVD